SDIAATTEILVVVGDDDLTAALEALPNVVVFSTLRELLDSDEFDDLRSEIEAENVTRAVEALRRELQLFEPAVEEGLVTISLEYSLATVIRHRTKRNLKSNSMLMWWDLSCVGNWAATSIIWVRVSSQSIFPPQWKLI